MEMGGILGALLPYLVITVGIILAIWAIYRWRDKADIIFDFAEPAIRIAKSIVRLVLPNNVEKQERILDYVVILETTVSRVNRMKTEMDAELPAGATKEQRHKLYRDKAIELANTIASEQGIKVDTLSETVAGTIVDLILDKLPDIKGVMPEMVTNVNLPKDINK